MLLPTNFNIALWSHLLKDYFERDLLDFLKYGFPLGYTGQVRPTSVTTNHGSATRYPTHITHYLTTEIGHRAILGPFQSPPFDGNIICNPLMSRPK